VNQLYFQGIAFVSISSELNTQVVVNHSLAIGWWLSSFHFTKLAGNFDVLSSPVCLKQLSSLPFCIFQKPSVVSLVGEYFMTT
jgi:hypothetical protein